MLSVVYSLALSLLFYRDLTFKRFCDNMVEAGMATGVVMLVIMGSAAVGWVLTFDQVPQNFAAWVSANISNPFLIILMMNILMLIVGMPLDLPPSILLLGPIFVPLAAAIGLDPVQLGLIMVINLGIGLYTPPIGTTLFISSSIAKTSLGGDNARALALLRCGDGAADRGQLCPCTDALLDSLPSAKAYHSLGGGWVLS